MPNSNDSSGLIGNATSLIAGASGIMLVFIFNVVSSSNSIIQNIGLIRYASIFLLVSIIASLLTLQFAISGMKFSKPIAEDKRVGGVFLLSWLAFLIGGVFIFFSVIGV